jgi:L-alanine-DL-glutamate epimerase-like enolase superfamily enzyme
MSEQEKSGNNIGNTFKKRIDMNRRDFLHKFFAASGFLALKFPELTRRSRMIEYRESSDKKIKTERIELFPVRYPMTGYFKFFTGPHGSAGRAAVIIKITADNGLVGWGQSLPIAQWSYETLETSTVVLRDYLAPVLIGMDPTDIEKAHNRMDQAVAPGFSTGMPISRAGLDIALHDIKGKLLGKSLAQMWGKTCEESIALSWTVNVKNLDDVGEVVEQGKTKGYRHFNIKVSPDPDFDAVLAEEVRRLAPEAFLWADANGGYEPDTALRAAPMLADKGVDVLEAPLRPNRISGYQALKKQEALPILMDEGVITPVDLSEFFKLNMMDGVAMKPQRCGGLLSNKRQIEYCLKNNLIWLGSGLTDPDISLAASLMLYGAYGLKTPAALNGPQFLTTHVLKTPLRIQSGQAFIPKGPGLGIEVDEEKVMELCKQNRGRKWDIS